MKETVLDKLETGETISHQKFAAVLEMFHQQSKHPPGGDRCIGACYKSLLSLVEEDSKTRSFLEEIHNQRPTLPPAYFVNLFFRSIQYIKLYVEQDQSYLSYYTPQDWKPVLSKLLNSENGEQLQELMKTKETITTKYQRYTGPKALLTALLPNKELSVADFGCGTNYGLRGIELGEPFEPIVDQTPNKQVTKLLENTVRLREGVAIDKQNPADPEVQAWSMACSYYPSELNQIAEVQKLEERLRLSKRTMFLQADLLSKTTLEVIPAKHFHAVILSTILYQQQLEAREAIIAEAERVVRPDGILIIQDFATKNPSKPQNLSFEEPWFNHFGYRTFFKPGNSVDQVFEIFQWSDGRCHKIRPGEDYLKIFA